MSQKLIGFVVALLALGACGVSTDGHSSPPIRVSAAISVSASLRVVSDNYERLNGTAIVLNVGGSDTLATQILAGANVDVFFSADDRQMERVMADGGILAPTRFDLLANQLAVVAPLDQPISVLSIKDLQLPWVRRIAMGDPDGVPAGVYAKRYLESVRLWEAVRSKVIPTRNVRAALAAVEAGNADLAFVYRTDLNFAERVGLAFAIPVDAGPQIRYPIAVTADAINEMAARRFLAYLRGAEARRVFEAAGFIVLGSSS